jgi:phosphonate transport system substrate-binding protein
MKLLKFSVIAILVFLSVLSCSKEQAELGTKKNPIKMYFVPSVEAGKIITSGKEIATHLEQVTGYSFHIAVPTSYASVIEALGTKETDIAWLATFAYILANEKFEAQVALTTVRNGLQSYRGQFVVKADSPIKSIDDIAGRVIAYTDAASTSGYIYPSAILAQSGIVPRNTIFAGGHPQAILAVLQGRADVGCTYWSPPENGAIRDARDKLLETYPDIENMTRIVGFTDWIPNDTVTFRKDFPEEMKQKIVQALLDFADTETGHQILLDLFNIDHFIRSSNADYDVVRDALRALKTDAAAILK